MSLQGDVIPENVFEDGLNANAETNNDNGTNNSVDRCGGDKSDKPDYLNVDCDRNLNIRCVNADFEVTSCAYLLFALYKEIDTWDIAYKARHF